MSMEELNWCTQAAVMLHDGKEISDEKMAELKAIFLEGLIRFLDIYAQTEIGEGFELDITKIALHINSPQFENDDLYAIKSVEDVYELCESLVLCGLPIWRFLRLNKWETDMLEKSYDELLISAKRKAADARPCYGCIWYKESETFLGTLRRCNKPRTDLASELERREAHDPEEIISCEWLTTLTKTPNLNNMSGFRRRQFEESIEPARKRFEKELLKDPFRIPKQLSKDEIVDLSVQYEAWEDFGCAWNNKRSKSYRQYELRKAMFTEGAIRFFEIFASSEIGNDYVANIKNIALWLDDYELKPEINKVKTYEDVYCALENMLLESKINVLDYIQKDED